MQTVTGLRTIVKFFTNVQPNKAVDKGDQKIYNRLITRTLGKLGVINSKWKPTTDCCPKDGEFWLVEILRETCPARPQGVFVLEPIRPVSIAEVQRLAPGMYESANDAGVIIITPKLGEDFYWMLPLSLRKSMTKTMTDVNAVVVRCL